MDLWERLSDSIDSIQGLPMPCSMGFLNGEDTLCLYSMPGSRTVEEY
ncbi:capsid protein, partial [Enterococcus faecium]|nr:capsid protein [Enterococcus faecium]